MSTETAGRHAEFNPARLFILSTVALVTTAFVFSLRASSMAGISESLFQGQAAKTSENLTGVIGGAAFLGFAVSIFIGSPLCDYLGMRNLLGLGCFLHIGGTAVAIMTTAGPHAADQLKYAMFVVGLANGLVEAVINPLAATIYPDDKTHRLNVLHAWWPGGLILGGLLGFALAAMKTSWQVKLAFVIVPAVIYGAMLLGSKFPPTERVAAGVSGGDMVKEAFRPLFLLLLLCMLITASSELAPGQWLDSMLTRVVGFRGILLLVYVSGIMFVARHFAGTFAHRLSPIGLMCVACLLASVGLLMLSRADSKVTGIIAATIWACGVCFMWPTMLGIASERFPKGGALLIGLMGFGGNVGTWYTVPLIGTWFDSAKIAAANATEYKSFDALKAAAESDTHAQAVLNQVLSSASSHAFQLVAILPLVPLTVFVIWWLVDKSKGGYRAVKLSAADAQQ